MRLHTKAGLLYLLPVVAMLITWYIILFRDNPPGVTPWNTLAYLLTSEPRVSWFRWLTAIPFISLMFAVANFSRIVKSRSGSFIVVALGAAFALAAWITSSIDIALLTTLPLVYGILATAAIAREAQNGA